MHQIGRSDLNIEYNVWSEFQPLEQAVVGNICEFDDIGAPFTNQKHRDNFRTVLDYTFEDIDKIKTNLNKLGVVVHQCESYPLKGTTPPLEPRDWFMVYGDSAIVPLQQPAFNRRRSRSLDHVLHRQITGEYIDTASFLRCGNDIFYSDDYGSQGTKAGEQFITNALKEINPNIRLHKISNCGAHLDGSMFFVRPGLIITTLDQTELPPCLRNWDIIDCNRSEAMQVSSANVWQELFKYKHKKFHPFIVEKWLWYKNRNPDETCFSLNALSINEECVMMPGYNKYVFDQLKRYKIDVINLDLKSLDFWDAGLHCFTNELVRSGGCVDYFN